MKRIFLGLAVLTLALFGTLRVAYAATGEASQTPEGPTFYQIGDVYTPRLLPDSPWYFLKVWRDGLQLFLTSDPVKKLELKLTLANKRILEYQRVCELSPKTCERFKEWPEKYAKWMREAEGDLEKVKAAGKDVTALVAKLEENLARQQAVLERVYQLVPEAAKQAILQAKENSQKGLENAMEKVAGQGQGEKVREKLQKRLQEYKGEGSPSAETEKGANESNGKGGLGN
ncbi:MAG: DUF5667 domain-containing protein [bacterium]|nr:DUF5667 domain-containing protein [bacterium]